MRAGLGPNEWTCDECSPGLPAAQKGSRILTSKHTAAGRNLHGWPVGRAPWPGRPSGSWAPGQGISDGLSPPLSLQKAQTCALPSSLMAVLVISPLQFQLHHLGIGSPGAPADRTSTLPQRTECQAFPSCRQAVGVWHAAGPVGSGSQCGSGPFRCPVSCRAPRLGPTGVPAPAPLGPGPPSRSRVEQAS